MSSRRRLGALLLLPVLTLTGCGALAEEQPATSAPSATTPVEAPPEPGAPPEAAPEPATEPTTEPAPEPQAPAGLCEPVHAALQEARALNPEPETIEAALGAATDATPQELAAAVGTVELEVRDYLTELAEAEGAVGPLEVTVPAELLDACAAAEVELSEIPFPVAEVTEICFELHQIAGYQDPKGWDLEEIVVFFLDRATTYTPPELEEGVQAYRERSLPLYTDKGVESEESHRARTELGEVCAAEGLPLLQPE